MELILLDCLLLGDALQEQPRRKSQTLTFSEEGFPVVRPLGQSKVPPVNDTQENYDNSGACYACVKQSTGPTPAWLKYDRQVLSHNIHHWYVDLLMISSSCFYLICVERE
jgi:hypothetical protein